jgi:hypothetical protein
MLKTFLVRAQRKVLRVKNEAVEDDWKMDRAWGMYEEKKCISGFGAEMRMKGATLKTQA